VYVEGRLHTRRYTDKDGIERYATDIIAEQMQMLGTPAAARQHAQEDADAHQGAVSQQDAQTYQAYTDQPAEVSQAAPATEPAKAKTPSKPAPKRASKPAAAAPAN
jgi:single-strand DNA-binding protein